MLALSFSLSLSLPLSLSPSLSLSPFIYTMDSVYAPSTLEQIHTFIPVCARVHALDTRTCVGARVQIGA